MCNYILNRPIELCVSVKEVKIKSLQQERKKKNLSIFHCWRHESIDTNIYWKKDNTLIHVWLRNLYATQLKFYKLPTVKNFSAICETWASVCGMTIAVNGMWDHVISYLSIKEQCVKSQNSENFNGLCSL